MRTGGIRRRRWKAAAALVVLTLLPAAVLVGSAHASAGAAAHGGIGLPRAQDFDFPSAEAVRRSQASNLFAPFAWDGLEASGPFVRFDYMPGTGSILDYRAVNGSATTILVDTIQIPDLAVSSTPLLLGATFALTSNNVVVVAHDEPMALLEIRTLGHAANVTFRFPENTTGLLVSRSTQWPASTLAFSDGNDSGRIIVGHGSLNVTGNAVRASLASQDYLALSAVPAFAQDAALRTALLDAFASGRLAAEFDMVAVSNGGWLENSAQYHTAMGTVDSSVQFSQVAVSLDMHGARGGLVLLAFDPATMPADAQHHLVVRSNGTDIPASPDALASLFNLPGSSDRAAYVQLDMNATVLAVYVPDLSSVNIQVQSVTIPAPGIDRPTELAVVAAMFVVAVAATVMFRRRPT